MTAEGTFRPKQINQVIINASQERVWDAITKPEFTARYVYGSVLRTNLAVGSPFTYLTPDGNAPLIDGEVQPEQYAPARIVADDVQQLLRRMTITPQAALSAQFPQRLPADLEVELRSGVILRAQRSDYHGFYTHPFHWPAARAKFDRLARKFTTAPERDAIAQIVASLDRRPIGDLTRLLGRIRIRADAAQFSLFSEGQAP